MNIRNPEPMKATFEEVMKARGKEVSQDEIKDMELFIGSIVGELDPPKAVEIIKKVKILRPPGFYLFKIIAFIYPKKLYERIFEPIFVDMNDEYNEALSIDDEWKAKWVHFRGLISVFIAVSYQLPFSLVKMVKDIWSVT